MLGETERSRIGNEGNENEELTSGHGPRLFEILGLSINANTIKFVHCKEMENKKGLSKGGEIKK